MEPASPDLRHRLRVASRRLGLTAFWRWWAAELVPLIPHKLRNAVGRMRMRPVLAFDENVAVLWVPEVANSHLAYKEAARIPMVGDQDATAAAGSAAIDALTRSTVAGRANAARVVVALPASQVLRKTINLPAAVEDNLHQVLAYDLDRHTPFKPDEMTFDAVIVGRDPARRELRVAWAAALKSVVEQSRRRAESWGATVTAVTPDAPGGGRPAGGRALNLLPEALRPDTSARRRWEVWAPIALMAAATLFAVALPLWQKRGYAIALMQQASQGRVQADASSALREQLERLTGDYNFALSKKYAYPSALRSVEDVTKILPDDTWLTQLEMKSSTKGKETKRELMVRGESANAGRLVSLFEESKLFGETAPRSPTTKIQPGPGEIFDLGAQLKPLPPPPFVQVAAMDSSVPPAPAPAVPAAGNDPAKAAPSIAPDADAAKAPSVSEDGSPPAAPPAAVPPAAVPPAAAPPAAPRSSAVAPAGVLSPSPSRTGGPARGQRNGTP